MFKEFTVAAYFTMAWRIINDASLSRYRRKAMLVAVALDLSPTDVLLMTLQAAALAAAGADTIREGVGEP